MPIEQASGGLEQCDKMSAAANIYIEDRRRHLGPERKRFTSV